MKALAAFVFLAIMTSLTVACGDGGSGGSGGSGNQNCESSHTCVNGACTCDTSGKQGNACTDDDKCVSECQVCS